jgi:hypothetical protein
LDLPAPEADLLRVGAHVILPWRVHESDLRTAVTSPAKGVIWRLPSTWKVC